MQSIRKRLIIIFILTFLVSGIISAVLINYTFYDKFNKYISANQDKRNTRIVDYFQQIYSNQKGWDKDSGEEMIQDAYLSGYYISLLDINKNVIWQMNPNYQKDNQRMMRGNGPKGDYTSNTFPITVDNLTVGYVNIGQYASILMSEEDMNFRKTVNKNIGISTLIAILIASLVSLIVSKQFSDPIKKVSETSMSLSNGNYEARTNIKPNIKELNNLVNSINVLGNQLEKQDTLRKRLVSDISHEIRTPLNVLENNLEAMIDGVLPITNERLNNMNEEVIRFGKLLNNLNSLKKFDEDDINVCMETVNLDKILKTVYEEFSIPANNKNIELIYNLSPNVKPLTLGDSDKLKQVFVNLLSNSIKFTQEHGKVSISLDENKDKLIVVISDTGIGIKSEDLPFVFERFYRGDKSRNITEGNGIGLTIVKKILSLHSATIEIESKVNKGTKVNISFAKI